jgi:tellurite resistance protein
MTPKEKAIVKALVAVAWADGEMQEPEGGVIEGLLSGFDASPAEESEILRWATTPRSLKDVDVSTLDKDDRELLLSNAALLVQSDGEESDAEQKLLSSLGHVLEFSDADTKRVIESVRRAAMGANPPNSVRN